MILSFNIDINLSFTAKIILNLSFLLLQHDSIIKKEEKKNKLISEAILKDKVDE